MGRSPRAGWTTINGLEDGQPLEASRQLRRLGELRHRLVVVLGRVQAQLAHLGRDAGAHERGEQRREACGAPAARLEQGRRGRMAA